MSGLLRQARLVGRLAETGVLDEALRTAAEANPVAVIIAGDAGIGKSRLAAEVCSRAAAEGWQLLSAGCIDLAEGSVPYLALVDALRSLTAEELPPVLEHWRRGEIEKAATQLSPDTARGRVYAAYLDLLRAKSAEAPLALVIEDVHWADRATRDLLSYLIRGLGTPQFQARIFVLLTYRSDELTRTSPVRGWLSELLRLPGVSRLDLGPLDQAAVIAQLTSLGTFDGRQAGEIYRRSEGNPFYVEELAAIWSEGELRVPEAVRNLADVRVGQLEPQARDLVRLLAAVGRPATFELLDVLSSDSTGELLGALHAAVDSGILTVDRATSTYRFRHALFAEAVLDQFLPGERAAVHGIIAAVLAQRPELSTGPSELGYHQAAAGDLQAALVSYLAAAEEAERVYAFGEAGQYLERVLELWARVPEAAERAGRSRGNVLAAAGEHVGRVGDFDRAVAFATAALAEPDIAGDPERGAELWQRIATYHLQDGNGPRRSLPTRRPPRCSTRHLRRGVDLDSRPNTPWHSASGERMTKRSPRPSGHCGSLQMRVISPPEVWLSMPPGVAHVSAGRIEDGEPDLREALDLARAHGSHEDIGRAMLNLGHLLLCAGRNEECLELSEAAITENEASGLDLRRGAINRNNASQALFALGRWDEAIAQTDIVRSRIEFRFAGRMAYTIRARIATARGEDNLAASLLSWVKADGRGRGEPDIVAYWWLVVAESAAWAGRYDEGRAAIAAGLALVTGNDALSTARLCPVGLRLEADRCISAHMRRARSEEAAARQRADELAAAAANVVGRGEIEAWAAQARAESLRLGASNPSLLINEWVGVRDRWRSLRQPYPEAYASLRVAEAELAAGDRRAAAAELSSATTLAAQLGAAPLAALIADVARRGGIEAIPTPGSDGLTPREREILNRVLAGASNRDIAKALFISPKTVSVHVSALLRKFGVSGRGDLMAAAQKSEP